MSLTFLVLSVAPRANDIHFALEAWIMHGWITGLYLSLSCSTIRPLVHHFFPVRLNEYVDVAHGLQIPFVVGGVGTWAVAKLMGIL